jgi:hypothetical protein
MKSMSSHPRGTSRRLPDTFRTLIALATATLTVSATPPKLALIWPTHVEVLKDVRSLVELGLVETGQVVLLERNELDPLLEEQRAVLAGLTEEGRGVAVGRLQGADLVGLCLEERSPEQGDVEVLPSGLRLMLFEVQTSFKLVDESFALPEEGSLSTTTLGQTVLEQLRMGLTKFPVSTSGVVKLGIEGVRMGSWEPEALPAADALGAWLSRLLVRSPNVVVLERRYLGASLWERLFRPELELPLGCDVIVRPALTRLPNQHAELRITLVMTGADEPVTLPLWTGTELTPHVVINQVAAILSAVRAAPSQVTTPDRLADEARRLFDRAYWAAKTARELEAYQLAEAVLILEPGHGNAQLLRRWLQAEVNAERFRAWDRLTAAERQQTLAAQAWCMRDYYTASCAFVRTNRNAWSGWIRFGDLEDGYELGWRRAPPTHGRPELDKLNTELAVAFADFYQEEVERRQEEIMVFQLHSQDFGAVLLSTLRTVREPHPFFEVARRMYLLEVGRYPWRNGMALQRPGVTYQAMSLVEAVRQFRIGRQDGVWGELREFHRWLREQPEFLGAFLADWLVFDCWRDVPARAFEHETRPGFHTSGSWNDTLAFARATGPARADCVRRLGEKVPAILSRAGGRKLENLKPMLWRMRFLDEAETCDLLEIWAHARSNERACPTVLAWRLAGIFEEREDWEAVQLVTGEALSLLQSDAPEGRDLLPAHERALARLDREPPGLVLWSSAREVFRSGALSHPAEDWIVEGEKLFWIDTTGRLHGLHIETGGHTPYPALRAAPTNNPPRAWDVQGWFPRTRKLAFCRDRLFACYRADGLLELDVVSGNQRLVDARAGLPVNRVLMLVPLDDRLICLGVRSFSKDLNVSPPKVVFTFDPVSGRTEPLAGSEIGAPGFPNRHARHLEVVDLSPDPVRGGLWATLLVNNRSKLYWYSATGNKWHELLDQFFDWHFGQLDRLLQPHPAGVLVGRHLYDANAAELRPVTEIAGAHAIHPAESLALIGPHVVHWNGATWAITGGQRLARLGGPGQGLEVGARLQPPDERIVRLLPTSTSLLVVTRKATDDETAFGLWKLDPLGGP